MKYKTITYDGIEYNLVPKQKKNKNEVIIEGLKERTKRILYVRTRYIRGDEFDRLAEHTDDKWIVFRREEWSNSNFNWFIEASKTKASEDDYKILETWYQENK